MQRYVWIKIDIPWGLPAREVLQERLADFDPKLVPYGGARRRVRLTIDSADAIEGGQVAMEKLRLAIADWGDLRDAFVDEIVLVTPVDPGWEALADA